MQVRAAVDTDALEKALPEEAKGYVEITPESGDLKSGLAGIVKNLLFLLRESLRTSISEGFTILSIAALSGTARLFSGVSDSEPLKKAVDLAAVCAVTALCISGASGVLESCSRSIGRLGNFSAALIPAYAAAVAVTGHPLSAVSTASATLIFSNGLIFLASKLLIPAIYLHIVLSAVGLIADHPMIRGAASMMRRGALGFFKYFLMLYTGYVSMSGLISSGTDAVTLRTAKVTISGSVPVLGTIVSDVSDALLSGAVILKNAVGIYGFIGALAVCLLPFATAGAKLLVFRLLSLLSASLCGGTLTQLLNSISESYSMALGLLGTCCAVQFLSFVIGSVVIGA
ncbi:MAG: hypothetical protein PUB63_07345 [Clostridia bacterium]|nr:hypothetical protein [Clostridia bacterium]